MKRFFSLLSLIFFLSPLLEQNSVKVYFNEVRPDNAGTDNSEFIELIGPVGTDLNGFKIIHFNGAASSDGGLWTHIIGSFTIPDDGITDSEGNSLGFFILADIGVSNQDETLPDITGSASDIQGGPDGVFLFDSKDKLLDAIAWEGTGDIGVDDPDSVVISGITSANNYLHVTIDDDAGDNSLQAPNSVFDDDGTNWTLAAATPGAINTGQVSGSIQLTSSETDIPTTMINTVSGTPITVDANFDDATTGIVSVEVKAINNVSLEIPKGSGIFFNTVASKYTGFAVASLSIEAKVTTASSPSISLLITDAVGNRTVWVYKFFP